MSFARYYVALSALNMAVVVMFGAFGAHALAIMVDAKHLATWQTAVNYHLIHSIALLTLAIWLRQGAPTWVVHIALGLVVGIVLFSGSLYAWVLTDWSVLVFLTPVGGSVWVLTWLFFAWKSSRI